MRNARRLVIDTDVGAHAIGGERDELGPPCRTFLNTVQHKTRHLMVLSEEIRQQWDRRCKRDIALTFSTWMELHERTVDLEDPVNDTLRDCLRLAARGEAAKDKMLKDAPLLEAALVTDKIVCSCDDEASGLFAGALNYAGLGRLGDLMWVDPTCDPPDVETWLVRGARRWPERTLGAKAR